MASGAPAECAWRVARSCRHVAPRRKPTTNEKRRPTKGGYSQCKEFTTYGGLDCFAPRNSRVTNRLRGDEVKSLRGFSWRRRGSERESSQIDYRPSAMSRSPLENRTVL